MNEVVGRDRMVSEARRLVGKVDENGMGDVDPQVVALCRRMVEAGEEARMAVQEGLATISLARTGEDAGGDGTEQLRRLEVVNAEIDRLGAELLRLV
jgi:hypothetical protein